MNELNRIQNGLLALVLQLENRNVSRHQAIDSLTSLYYRLKDVNEMVTFLQRSNGDVAWYITTDHQYNGPIPHTVDSPAK